MRPLLTFLLLLCVALPSMADRRGILLSKKPAGGAAVYNPSNDMTGMLVWLNPDTQSEADGDPIVTFSDRSGNGYDFIQTDNTTRRPKLRHNSVNGRKLARLDGVSAMYNTAVTLPDDIIVFWAASNQVVRTVYDFNTGSQWVLSNIGENRFWNFPDMAGFKTSSGGFNIFSFGISNGQQIAWENGVPFVGHTEAESGGTGRMTIFANESYGYAPIGSDFGDFLVYSNNATMTTARRQQIEQYLCTKYNRTYGEDPSAKVRVYCVGNSITIGSSGTATESGSGSWPAYLQTALGSGYEVINLAVSAQTTLQQSNLAPFQVHPFHSLSTSGGKSNILVWWNYVNDVEVNPYGGDAQGTLTTNEAFVAISNYFRAASNSGWGKTVVLTDFHTNQNIQNVVSLVTNGYQNFAPYLVHLDHALLKTHSLSNGGDGVHLPEGGWKIVAHSVSNLIKGTIYP